MSAKKKMKTDVKEKKDITTLRRGIGRETLKKEKKKGGNHEDPLSRGKKIRGRRIRQRGQFIRGAGIAGKVWTGGGHDKKRKNFGNPTL